MKAQLLNGVKEEKKETQKYGSSLNGPN